jgi:hypothetical protein
MPAPFIIILIALLILTVLILIVWVAYSVTAAYQQTLTVLCPFNETYRYIPSLSKKNSKLDSIKITVTGRIKKKSESGPIITLGSDIKKVVHETILDPYSTCLIMHETNTFTVEEQVLKRHPLSKEPTLENLSIIFFNKLVRLMPKLGCQLVSVSLQSQDLEVSHSRYKINSFHM